MVVVAVAAVVVAVVVIARENMIEMRTGRLKGVGATERRAGKRRPRT